MFMDLFPSFQKPLRLHLKDHSLNAAQGNSHCLFSELCETHKWHLQNI